MIIEESQGWAVIAGDQEDGSTVRHVIPHHDLYKHEFSDTCWCTPEEDLFEDDQWQHRSADGREDYEDRRRKPH